MTRTQYSDDEKASALTLLAVNNGNLKRTARALGIPRSTLSAWAKGRGTHARVTDLCHFKKGVLADRLEEAARKLLDAVMDPARIEGASMLDLCKSIGICVDRMVLLRR
ncbi:MAG: helix-turn-helix domain-containing protein [Pyrinomonadaceae bacterium]